MMISDTDNDQLNFENSVAQVGSVLCLKHNPALRYLGQHTALISENNQMLLLFE